jgi:hypothetical protein
MSELARALGANWLGHLACCAATLRHASSALTSRFRALRVTLDAGAFEWADCEALERRHNIGRGSLVVLDVIPEHEWRAASYTARREWLENVLPIYDLNPRGQSGSDFGENSIGLAPNDLTPCAELWHDLQQINKVVNPTASPLCGFYEGVVMKRKNAAYPMQLRSDKQETANWIKHRWAY